MRTLSSFAYQEGKASACHHDDTASNLQFLKVSCPDLQPPQVMFSHQHNKHLGLDSSAAMLCQRVASGLNDLVDSLADIRRL